MSSRTFYTLVTFDMMFLGFLFLYNVGSNPSPQMERLINDVFGPWPIFQSGTCTVQWWDFFIPTSCTAVTLSSTVLWGFALLGSFFFRIGAMGTLALQLFDITLPGSSSAIPFLNYILIAFQIIIIMDFITVFRGSSTGA